MGPYPWRSILDSKPVPKPVTPLLAEQVSRPHEHECEPCSTSLDSHFQSSLGDLIAEAKPVDCIAFKLPTPNAVAGKVLQHAVKTMETLFSKHEPMIWKIGFTHSPTWRWTNELYGYQHSRDRWSNMVVLYASSEPYSPAMLEATLIEKYQSCA